MMKMLEELRNRISKLIFGSNVDLSFKRRIHILICFIIMIFSVIAFINTIVLALESYLLYSSILGFFVITYFYLSARNSSNHEKTVFPLYITSLFFIIIVWISNSGYEGTTLLLMIMFFLVMYILVKKKYRLIVLFSYLILHTMLMFLQYYYPEYIVDYDSTKQRFIDILISGIVYLLFFYFIIDIIVKNYAIENEKIASVNKELNAKNLEIAENIQEIEEGAERLSLAMSNSNQGWFDLHIPSGKLEVSHEYLSLIGYNNESSINSFQNWLDIIHPEDVEKVAGFLNNAIFGDSIATIEYRIMTKSREWKWMQSTGRIVEFSNVGNPLRMIGIVRDITERRNVENKLRESEEKYRTLVYNSMEGIAILDLDGTIIFANQAVANIFKLNQIDEVIGKKVFEFIAPESIPKVAEDFENAVNGEESYISVYLCYAADGSEIWIESIGKIIHYEGKLADLISFRDITDRKQTEEILRQSEEKYRNLFDTMPNGFYRSTAEGYFLDANPAFIKMLGYDSLEELKKVFIPTDLYVHESERDELNVQNTDFINQIETYRLKRKDGKIVWIEDNARYIKDDDGNILYNEGVCKDITDRIKQEKELRESEARLRELNATKDRFFSIIAHDLKNPLGSFKDASRLLFDEYDTFNEMDRKHFLEMIMNSSQQVYALLENLLDWIRSQRGLIQFNPVQVNLFSIAQNVLDLMYLTIDNKCIEYENIIPHDIMVMADINLVNTIIRNIISNAIKFTPENGKIIIGVEEISEEDMVKIYIKDSGVGMSQEILEKLFRIDQNVTQPGTANEKGTGLGLILCKEFVEKHGGNISVKSKAGKGSIFYFTLSAVSKSEMR